MTHHVDTLRDALENLHKSFGETKIIRGVDLTGNYDSASVEAARLKLANAVLSVAREDSRDVEALKQAALEVMTRVIQSRIARPMGGSPST